MKYIRTKNGIYELKSNRVFNHVKEYKLADTIEELCDEFVCITSLGRKIISKKPTDILCFDDEDIQWFGAIWTDKGLIYVAKMNDKGELELL